MAENKLFPQDPNYDYSDILPLAKRKGSPKGFGGVTLAVPNMLRDAAESVNTLLRTPGEALRGELSSAEIMQRAPGMAMSLMGLSSPVPVPAGALRVFGGIGAKTADHDALALAKKLWWNGSKDEEIFGKTGWFKDKDRNWKFEIPDNAAQWKGGSVGLSKAGVPLGDVLEHPDLFNAYPHMQDFKLKDISALKLQSRPLAAMDAPAQKLYLSQGAPNDMLSNTLHEIQHGIQHYENFADGGSVQQFLPDGFDELYQDSKDRLENVREQIRSHGVNSVVAQRVLGQVMSGKEPDSLEMAHVSKVPDRVMMDLHDALSDIIPMQQMRDSAYKDYLRLGGEVESRNVQERFENPDNYLVHPFRTPGYPTGAQIFNWPEGTPNK